MNRNIFIELGAEKAGHLTPLVRADWKEHLREFAPRIPEWFFDYNVSWKGYLVEPNPEHFKVLLAHLREHNFENIVPILGAIGSRVGFRELTTYTPLGFEGSVMSSLTHNADLWFNQVSDICYNFHIFTFTLDDLLDWIGFEPTILRMDIELSEVNILNSFSWQCRPFLWQIDHHGHQGNIKWMVNLFESHGYKILGTDLGDDAQEIWCHVDGD